ncbi:MAG: hypothetical protein RhofKO_19590 [Rhodothermales bacterium]
MRDFFYFISMNLALTNEPNSLCVLRRTICEQTGETKYEAVHLERFALGTSYQAMAAHAAHLMGTEPLAGHSCVIVDAARVGTSVIQHFQQATQGLLQPVCITTERVAGISGHCYTAPLCDLVGLFQMLQGEGRVLIAETLALAGTLRRELNSFRFRQPSAELDVYEAIRAGTCTDLVLALLLGLWTAERLIPHRRYSFLDAGFYPQ